MEHEDADEDKVNNDASNATNEGGGLNMDLQDNTEDEKTAPPVPKSHVNESKVLNLSCLVLLTFILVILCVSHACML